LAIVTIETDLRKRLAPFLEDVPFGGMSLRLSKSQKSMPPINCITASGPSDSRSSFLGGAFFTSLDAHRCILDQLPSLHPFQRKLAFFDQVMALVDTASDYLLPHQQEEIICWMGTSKELMQPKMAWKRMKLIEKEAQKVVEKIRALCE
jgi:hypothetical protein